MPDETPVHTTAAAEEVDQVRWDTLVGKIKQGNCTPILGAGASAPLLPLGGELAEELLREEEERTGPSPLANRRDLPKVCQYIAVRRADSGWPKQRITEHLRNRGLPSLTDSDDPHNVLASLKLPVYLTTNYDDFMFRALSNPALHNVVVKREFARWTPQLLDDYPSAFDTGYVPDRDNPVVFHIHGQAGVPESMVATEDDYLDFLVTISRDLNSSPAGSAERAVLPPRIRRALTNSTLLFLGYSLDDVNFRVILRGLVNALPLSARQFHLAVQFSGKPARELEDYLKLYFQWTLNITLFWMDVRKFSAELRRRVEGS